MSKFKLGRYAKGVASRAVKSFAHYAPVPLLAVADTLSQKRGLSVGFSLNDEGLFRRLGEQLHKHPLPPADKGNVLFLKEYPFALRMDLGIALALRLRGYNPQILFCDRFCKTCDFVNSARPLPPCQTCQPRIERAVQAAGLPFYRLSEFAEPADDEVISAWFDGKSVEDLRKPVSWRGYDLHEMVMRHMIHHYHYEDPWVFPSWPSVLRRSLEQVLRLLLIYERVLEQLEIHRIYMFSGLLITSYPLYVIARRKGLDCAITEYPYQIGRAWVKPNEAPQDFGLSEEWRVCREAPLGDAERKELYAYLKQRRDGTARDYINFQWSGQARGDDLRQLLKIPPTARVALAVCNLTWDTSLFELHTTFSSMTEWIIHTVRRFVFQVALLVCGWLICY